MKKLTISVGILLMSLNSYGQSNQCDSISFGELEVIDMINVIEDILEWNQFDRENGETSMGSYEEGWGSDYWLTIMKDELYNKLKENE